MNDIKVNQLPITRTVFSELRIGCVTGAKNKATPFQLSNPSPVLFESSYTVSTARCDSEILYHMGVAMQNLVGSEHQGWLCLASVACSEAL